MLVLPGLGGVSGTVRPSGEVKKTPRLTPTVVCRSTAAAADAARSSSPASLVRRHPASRRTLGVDWADATGGGFRRAEHNCLRSLCFSGWQQHFATGRFACVMVFEHVGCCGPVELSETVESCGRCVPATARRTERPQTTLGRFTSTTNDTFCFSKARRSGPVPLRVARARSAVCNGTIR